MEYSPLVWSSCPPSYLRLLDKVQERAMHLFEMRRIDNDPPIFFHPLQHRRDASGFCVFYKCYILQAEHLSAVRLPTTTRIRQDTRATRGTEYEFHIPFARTEQYLRTFAPRFSRIWNKMIRDVDLQLIHSLQQFKAAAYEWNLRNLHAALI